MIVNFGYQPLFSRHYKVTFAAIYFHLILIAPFKKGRRILEFPQDCKM